MTTEVAHEDEIVWRETCVFLSRWPESAERTGGRPPRPPKAPRDAAVLAELEVTGRTAWTYARVSGDYNPIHLNDRAARFFGLRGSISHGMWSLARSLAEKPVPVLPSGREDRDPVPDTGAAPGPSGNQGVDGRGPVQPRALRRSHRSAEHVLGVARRYYGGDLTRPAHEDGVLLRPPPRTS